MNQPRILEELGGFGVGVLTTGLGVGCTAVAADRVPSSAERRCASASFSEREMTSGPCSSVASGNASTAGLGARLVPGAELVLGVLRFRERVRGAALVVTGEGIDSLAKAIDAANADVGRAQRHMLRLIVDADRREIWRGSGARDTAHWLSIRYGISEWKARRWAVAAHALENLPHIAEALASGRLCLDKVVELARFAKPDDEARLVRWATTVSCGAVRQESTAAPAATARPPTTSPFSTSG